MRRWFLAVTPLVETRRIKVNLTLMKIFVLPTVVCVLALASIGCDVSNASLSPVQPSSIQGGSLAATAGSTDEVSQPYAKAPQTGKPVPTYTVVSCTPSTPAGTAVVSYDDVAVRRIFVTYVTYDERYSPPEQDTEGRSGTYTFPYVTADTYAVEVRFYDRKGDLLTTIQSSCPVGS